MNRLILASTSPYRRQQLLNLGYQFEVIPPEVEEWFVEGETPSAMSIRLAKLKAQAVAVNHPDAVVIGSDQVGFDGVQILTKPGSRENTIDTLLGFSGQTIYFFTGVCVCGPDAEPFSDTVVTEVNVRALQRDEIERYVALDQPWDCVGGFKSEEHGALLFNKVLSDDPTALVGLPLLRTSEFLRQLGINPLLML